MAESSPFHTLESTAMEYAGEYESMYTDSGPGAPGKMIPTLVDCQAPDEGFKKTYTDMDKHESMKTSDPFIFSQGPMKIIKSEESDLLAWTEKHPHNWTAREVLDWVYYVAQENELNHDTFQGDRFNDLTGEELCTMNRQHFLERDPYNGDLFYELLQNIDKNSEFTQPSVLDCPPLGELSYNGMDYEECMVEEGTHWNIDGHTYDVDVRDKFQDLADEGYCSGGSEHSRERVSSVSSCEDGSYDGYSQVSAEMGPAMPQTEPAVYAANIPELTPPTTDKPVKVKRPPGRPRKNPDGTPKPPSQRGRKPGQTAKGNHLWEFVRDLLMSPTHNPRLVKWEDKSEGVFRFVQSEQVAAMWGKKKHNPNMTYEKLSRAMRFCRTADYFQSVPKDGRYPKKLCFKFGPKAHGWHDNC